MGKRRIIVPNPKIEKNDIGKKDKKFNDIYTNNIETVNISTDNINTEKINGEIIDEERYLENQFTIIYPNNGSKETPANVSPNSRYIMDNPFPGYIVNTQPEIYFNNQWGDPGWDSWYDCGGNRHDAIGIRSSQLNNNTIVIQTGSYSGHLSYVASYSGSSFGNIASGNALPCRIKIWKVGKIK